MIREFFSNNTDPYVISVCFESQKYASSRTKQFAEFITIPLNTPAMILLFVVLFKKVTYKAHINFKIILANIWIATFVHLFSNIYTNLYMLHLEWTDDGALCHYVMPVWKCALMRWPITWTILAMMLIHLVMFVERVMASRCKSSYEQIGFRFGVISTYVIWLITAGVCYFAFTVEDYNAPLAYCLGTIPQNEQRVRMLLAIALPIDITITLGDFALQCINRRKKLTAVYTDYTLTRSYQMEENYFTSRVVFPVSLTHSLCYTVYLVVTIWVRNQYTYKDDPITFVTMVMSTHNLLIMSITACLIVYLLRCQWIRRIKTIKELKFDKNGTTNIYFRMLDEQVGNKTKTEEL